MSVAGSRPIGRKKTGGGDLCDIRRRAASVYFSHIAFTGQKNMNTPPNFSSLILSRLLTLLTNEERKFVLKRAKHKNCPVDLRGVRVHEKELANPRSLLHQRVVTALECGETTLLLPALTPLADRRADRFC